MAEFKRSIIEYERITGRKLLELRRLFNSAILEGGAKRKRGEEMSIHKKHKNQREFACETNEHGAYTGNKIEVTDCKGNGVFRRIKDSNEVKEMRYRSSDRGSVCEES